MRRLVSRIRNWFGGQGNLRPGSSATRRAWRRRLELEPLEDRALPAVSFGTVTGISFVDLNGNGIKDGRETGVQGVPVKITGTTTMSTTETVSTTTDAHGLYKFANLPAGTYTLTAGPIAGHQAGSSNVFTISGLHVTGGGTLTRNFAFRGLSSHFVSIRQFLTNSPASSIATAPAGPGAPAGNDLPFVKTAFSNVSVNKNTAASTIDLAGHFSIADLSNTMLRFDTSDGPINVELFDAQAPQTVANFLDYVRNHQYDNTFFHRLVTGFVLQGGGFSFASTGATGGNINPIITNPASPPGKVPNEFGMSNVQGTLSMAQVSGDPNSATDEFFFNLVNNNIHAPSTGTNLDLQKFAVFGKVASSTDLATLLNKLAKTPVVVGTVSNSATDQTFATIPLTGHSGTADGNFSFNAATSSYSVSDLTASNFLTINDVKFVTKGNFLTYTVTNISDPSIASATIDPLHSEFLNIAGKGKSGTVTITITATDMYGRVGTGTIKVTVNDRAPTASVTLNTTAPTVGTNSLTANVTASDPDGDQVSLTYVWQVNGVTKKTLTTTSTTDSLDLTTISGLKKTDVIKLTVTPNDGTLNGTAATATATVVNSAPVVGSVTFAPSTFGVTDMVTANVTASDPDNDTLKFTYNWTVNGTSVQTTGPTTSTSDTLDLSKVAGIATGQLVVVKVTANDGTVNGSPFTQSGSVS